MQWAYLRQVGQPRRINHPRFGKVGITLQENASLSRLSCVLTIMWGFMALSRRDLIVAWSGRKARHIDSDDKLCPR